MVLQDFPRSSGQAGSHDFRELRRGNKDEATGPARMGKVCLGRPARQVEGRRIVVAFGE